MRKTLFLILGIIFIGSIFVSNFSDARRIFFRSGYTGGTAADLDGIDGATVSVGDISYVSFKWGTADTQVCTSMHQVLSGTDSETGYKVVIPDTNAGGKMWTIISECIAISPTEPTGLPTGMPWMQSE